MAGSWAMLPILLCSALALAIILERFWTLRRKAVVPPGLGDEVREWARTRKLDPAHLEALRTNSPLGELLAAALGVRNRPRAIIKERVEDTGRHVVHRLERFLNTLGTIALVSPLLGLLGTVFGLISMFFAVMVSGVGDPLKMAGGIGEALVCTASGLCVAIPAYAFILSFVVMIIAGLAGLATDHIVPPSSDQVNAIAKAHEMPVGVTLAGWYLLLQAFSSGCSALTGMEAISNTTTFFKPPQDKNAAALEPQLAVRAIELLVGAGVGWRQRVFKAAVREHPHRVATVVWHAFGANDKVGDAGAIRRRDPELLC